MRQVLLASVYWDVHGERPTTPLHLMTDHAGCAACADLLEKTEAEVAAARAQRARQPDNMEKDMHTGFWVYTDRCGSTWQLTPTGDPSMPLMITILERR